MSDFLIEKVLPILIVTLIFWATIILITISIYVIVPQNKPTTTPKTAVDIVNYTCTTYDDLTMDCVRKDRG